MRDKQAVLSVVEFTEIGSTLPDVLAFVPPNESVDLFICALGFEERIFAIPSEMARSESHCRRPQTKAIICSYRTNPSENEANRERLENALMVFCKDKVELTGDSPSTLAQGLRAELIPLLEEKGVAHVIFDTSGASGNLILSVIHTLAKCAVAGRLTLTIAYAEPEHYFPSEEKYQTQGEELVLRACQAGDDTSLHEHGVSEVEINELFPGYSQDNRQEYILAIPSYRTERLTRCLRRLTDEPLSDPDSYVHWILGVPPSEERRWRLELQERVIQRLLCEVGGNPENADIKLLTQDNCSKVSTLDYRQIMSLMFHKVDTNLGKNISVVHMGSKLQAVGVSLVLSVRPEVTVCFARPEQYNPAQYSRGVGASWKVLIDDVGRLVKELGRIGTLRFISRLEPEWPDLRCDWDPQTNRV